MMNNNNNNSDRNSSSLNHGKRKKRLPTSMEQQPQHANSSLSSKQNDSVNSNNTNPSSSSTSKHCHHHHHHGTKTNNTTTRTLKHFDTEGQLINVESRIIDTPTNNNSVLNLPNSVLPAVDASSSKNNNEITNREFSASSSSSSPMILNIQTRGGLEGIFSQNNVDTMMSNIIQQILSTLSMQQERMNNIEQQQQQGFTTTPTNNMSNASKDPNQMREDQQQKIQQTCTINNQQQQEETPSSSSASSNNENQQFSDQYIGIERVVSSNYSSFNNGSGDVGQQGNSLTTSSSRSSSNNTTNSSTTSVTSTSSSSFVNNNSDSKRFTLSSGNTSSTLEFLNNNSTTRSLQNNHQQHAHNDPLSDSGISQLFEECTNSSFNVDASASSLTNLPKSTSEFNLEDYHDLFSDARSVREFGDDITSQQDPNAIPQFQSNTKQPNTVLDNMNEPMLWGMLRQMLTDNETLPNIQNEQNNEQAFNNPTSNSTSSNNSNMAPYFQVVSASSSSSSNIPPQSSGNNFRHNNFQQEQTHSTNFNNMPQSSNNNNNNNGNSNGNNMRQLISTLFSNLNTGRQTQPTLQLATIPDYKSEEVSEEIEENDFQLSSHPSDPPTADSTKQILGSIRKTLSNKINNTPNQFQHKYGQGVQQKPSDGFIKWLSEHSAPQNQQIKEQDTELEESSHHHHHQPPTSNMSQFKFYNEMISERNTSNTHPSSSNDNIKDSQSHSSTPTMKPLKIFQHDPHKQKKKKDLQNGEHIMNFQSPQSDNTVTTTTSIESTTRLDKSKRKRKDDKHDNQTETKRKKKTKKKKD